MRRHTVFPEPFQPTMRVSGALKYIVSPVVGPNERMLPVSAGYEAGGRGSPPHNLHAVDLRHGGGRAPRRALCAAAVGGGEGLSASVETRRGLRAESWGLVPSGVRAIT